MSAGVSAMPLPCSVRRDDTLPTIVTSSPSRTHTPPRPTTTRQWNRDHGNRSRRAGTCVVMVPVWAPALMLLRSGQTRGVPTAIRSESDDRAGRIIAAGAGQIALHPHDVVPAVELPFDASVESGIAVTTRSVEGGVCLVLL